MRRVLVLAVISLVAVPAAFAATPATTTTDTAATDTTATTTPTTTTTPAASGPIFGLRAVGNPKLGYFVYPGVAGKVIHGAVIVTNTGDVAGVVKIYTADATTGSTTGAVYLTDSAPTKAGSWIRLASSSLTLAPGKQATVPFTVTVPNGADAGQFVGGIVAETVAQVAGPKSKEKANVQIKVRNLSIVAVQVNVPGPKISKFTISKATIGGSKGFQQVLVHISNDGNVLAKPSGAVTIRNTSGLPIETIKFRMDTFLPHTSIDYPIVLKKGLPPGNYTAGVTLSYANAAGVTQTVTAAPALKVSQASVAQVFKSSTPTKVGSGVSSALNNGSSKGGKSAIKKYGPFAAGGLIVILLLVVLILLLSTRRPKPRPSEPDASAVSPEPVAPASAVAAAPAPIPTPSALASDDPCVPYHYWEVKWDQGRPGPNGVTLYPHRCRNCGIQVIATDINDAADQAAVKRGQTP
ncbi:MAG TPA: Fn3-like domain-containing protein [Gaiellaceae bacterium]|nr:Fn3-like domain-containing protein [Gaiellaceae bacterium]